MWQPKLYNQETQEGHHGSITIEETAQVAETCVGNWDLEDIGRHLNCF